MIIEKIWVNNFGVFGEDVKIDFTQYSTNDKVLVIGENNDAAGADSNGAGKTTLLNAISWAIFGRTPSDISSGDIVRRGMGACEVRIHLLDSDNKEIVIIRKRGVEGKHELQWFIDKEPQTERTMKSTQKNLLNYFGILENIPSIIMIF